MTEAKKAFDTVEMIRKMRDELYDKYGHLSMYEIMNALRYVYAIRCLSLKAVLPLHKTRNNIDDGRHIIYRFKYLIGT